MLSKKAEQGSTRNDSADGLSQSKECESVEWRPAFEIENYALHFTRAAGNY